MSFAQQHLLFVQIPVVQYVAHGDDVYLGQGLHKEISALEAKTTIEPVLLHILLENRPDFREVKADSAQVLIREGYLHGQIALRGADISEGLVLLPGNLLRDRAVGAVADARHGGQERLQPGGVRIERLEWRLNAFILGLILLPARAQRL